MGAGMCLRLADQGHEVAAWNRTKARADAMREESEAKERIVVHEALGDVLKEGAADAASAPPIVAILGTMRDVEELIEKAEAEVPGVWKGRTFVNLVSGNPDEGRTIGTMLAAKGVGHYVDAAYSGGPSKTRAGTGTLFLSSADKATTDVLTEGFLKDLGVPMWSGDVGASRALDYAVVDVALAVFTSWSANLSMLEKEGVPHDLVMESMRQRFDAVPGAMGLYAERMRDRSDEAYAHKPIATVNSWLNFTAGRLPYFKANDFSTVVPDFVAANLTKLSEAGHGGDDMTRLQEITRYTKPE